MHAPSRISEVNFRCERCRSHAAGSPIPLLLVVQPVNIDFDDQWQYLVIQQPRRIGTKHAAELAETRTRTWLRRGKRGTDPGPVFADRTRLTDIALVHEPGRKVVGGGWAEPLALTCPVCRHEIRWPYGGFIEAARTRALTGSHVRNIFV
jgi:hypothetical protein